MSGDKALSQGGRNAEQGLVGDENDDSARAPLKIRGGSVSRTCQVADLASFNERLQKVCTRNVRDNLILSYVFVNVVFKAEHVVCCCAASPLCVLQIDFICSNDSRMSWGSLPQYVLAHTDIAVVLRPR